MGLEMTAGDIVLTSTVEPLVISALADLLFASFSHPWRSYGDSEGGTFSIGEFTGAVNYEINGLAGYIDCFLSMKQHPLIKYNDGE